MHRRCRGLLHRGWITVFRARRGLFVRADGIWNICGSAGRLVLVSIHFGRRGRRCEFICGVPGWVCSSHRGWLAARPDNHNDDAHSRGGELCRRPSGFPVEQPLHNCQASTPCPLDRFRDDSIQPPCRNRAFFGNCGARLAGMGERVGVTVFYLQWL